MRIDPSTTIAGRPALDIRRLLRRTIERYFDVDTVRNELAATVTDAEAVLSELEKAGLIKKEIEEYPGREPPFWKNSIEGNAVAMATAARPVTRATAERVLAEFLDRVATVNGSNHLAYRIQRVTVFGSYLSEADRLNDVDLLVDLVPRHADREKQNSFEERIRRDAAANGRRFNNFVDQLAWPRNEVDLFLKKRSRTLSLHYADHAIVAQTEHRVVFENGTG